MENNLILNTKLFGFSGIIGKRNYFFNIIIILLITLCLIFPYLIWLFSNIQNFSDLFSFGEIFFESPIFLKFLFITGFFLNCILSSSNINRRLNDINGKINIPINIFVIFLFCLFNFCFIIQLQLCYLFCGAILEIILLSMRGKITESYDFTKEFNYKINSKERIVKLSDKPQEKKDTTWVILFFVSIPAFLMFIPMLMFVDTEKNNAQVLEKSIDKLDNKINRYDSLTENAKVNSNNKKQEPDFAPYMNELQSEIKKNWNPPKGKENKQVVLLFSIAKDGRLLNIKVKNSSDIKEVDDSAVRAVKLTAPFKALPSEFKGDKVDIEFTFDYKVFAI